MAAKFSKFSNLVDIVLDPCQGQTISNKSTPDLTMQELKEATEERYYRFREDELLNLTDPETGCGLRVRV